MPAGPAPVQYIELHACLASSFCLVSGIHKPSMTCSPARRKNQALQARASVLFVLVSPGIWAQGRGRGPAGPPPTPKAAAPVELTGYWVSIVTEDWRWRMVTPPKGDYASVPLNAEGRKVADAWDPVKDEAAGEQCKAYGAPGLILQRDEGAERRPMVGCHGSRRGSEVSQPVLHHQYAF
jgi:hypothetical protein